MDHFNYRDGRLFAEDVDLQTLAERFGTPAYVYSRATICRHFRVFSEALAGQAHLLCYAVKANSNLAVLNLLAGLGAGFDIVSVGELERVLRAGGDPGKVVFSGVGKRADEVRRALEVGIRCFNVESEGELERIDTIAREMGVRAPVSLRVNPDVDAQTHPYISTGLKENKFGIDIAVAESVYHRAHQMDGIRLEGIDCHIGSQLTGTQPFVDALARVLAMVDRLAEAGIHLRHIDVGGGLGIRYRNETPPTPDEYVRALRPSLAGRDLEILFEPGRVIVGNAGVLLTRVEYLKPHGERAFAIVDAGMNDLIRPALYHAWQDIVPVIQRDGAEGQCYDIVGPVCETADFIGRERQLNLEPGDILAVRSSGAYGFVMSSNYNSRPRPPEIMVDGAQAHVVRARESIDTLMLGESLLPN
ncbi:MAG: diaminopimelate decarboxylase [Pseudomonadota bacterium]|nr:diaminopimelate decarboxylase [Pseudomonadota bacterium]